MPLPTTNLVANFKASTGLTQSGGRLSVWADQSGLSNNAEQATEANQPYVTTDYLGNTVIRMSSNDSTFMTLPVGLTVLARAVSIFMVMSKQTSSNQSLISLVSYAGTSGNFRIVVGTSEKPNYYCVSRSSGKVVHRNIQTSGIVSGTNAAIYTNLGNTTGLTAVTNDATPRNIVIGRSPVGASYASSDILEIAIYDADIGATAAADVISYFNSTYGIPTSYTKQIVFEGDSISAGSGLTGVEFGLTYPDLLINSAISQSWRIGNLAVSGSQVSTLTTRAAQTDGMFEATGYTRQVLMVLIGRNDVTQADNSATVYSNLVTYCQARIATGWEVWVGTCIATGSTLQPTIDLLNDKIRGTSGDGIITDAGVTRIIDFAANSIFDETGDSTDLTYYQGDATHPTLAGAVVMASIVQPYLASGSDLSGTRLNRRFLINKRIALGIL